MKHGFRVALTTHPRPRHPHVEQWVQTLDDDDFDPEFRDPLNLAAAGWDQLVANTNLGSTLRDLQEPGATTEDDRIEMFFDGEQIADEYASHVTVDYFDHVAAR